MKSKSKPAIGYLFILVSIVGFIHFCIIESNLKTKMLGDELGYLTMSHEDQFIGDYSLLPHELRFVHRPPLTSRLYAYFNDGYDQWWETTFKNIEYLNLILLMATLILVFLISQMIGCGFKTSLLSVGILGANAWFGFFVHALWPEVLHAFLMCLSFFLILKYVENGRFSCLILASIFYAYAMLTKGTLNSFLIVVAIYLTCGRYLLNRYNLIRVKEVHSMSLRNVTGGIGFLLLVYMILMPKLAATNELGYGYKIASNTWRNIEYGIKRESYLDARLEVKGQTWKEAKIEYNRAASNYSDRDKQSKKRTIDFISEMPFFTLILRQSLKFYDLIFHQKSFLEHFSSKTRRWNSEVSNKVKALEKINRVFWFVLLISAAFGFFKRFRENEMFIFLGLFVLYYTAALFVISWKMRFAMQLMPVLSIFSAIGLVEFSKIIPRSDVLKRVKLEALVSNKIINIMSAGVFLALLISILFSLTPQLKNKDIFDKKGVLTGAAFNLRSGVVSKVGISPYIDNDYISKGTYIYNLKAKETGIGSVRFYVDTSSSDNDDVAAVKFTFSIYSIYKKKFNTSSSRWFCLDGIELNRGNQLMKIEVYNDIEVTNISINENMKCRDY